MVAWGAPRDAYSQAVREDGPCSCAVREGVDASRLNKGIPSKLL